jgi:hypothetical protein
MRFLIVYDTFFCYEENMFYVVPWKITGTKLSTVSVLPVLSNSTRTTFHLYHGNLLVLNLVLLVFYQYYLIVPRTFPFVPWKFTGTKLSTCVLVPASLSLYIYTSLSLRKKNNNNNNNNV